MDLISLFLKKRQRERGREQDKQGRNKRESKTGEKKVKESKEKPVRKKQQRREEVKVWISAVRTC